MARPKTILQSEFPYSVSARCINKEWFNLPMQEVWDVMTNHLYFAHHAYAAKIHSFVLMSNHFHLLLSTPQANLNKIMAYFMKETSRDISRLSGRINQTYGARYYKCIIRSDHYFMNSYKYIYRNPVEAGLCQGVEEYPYSTINGLLGSSPVYIPMIEDTLLFENTYRTLAWLNFKTKNEDRDSVKAALKRQYFKLPKNRNNSKPNHLEFDLL